MLIPKFVFILLQLLQLTSSGVMSGTKIGKKFNSNEKGSLSFGPELKHKLFQLIGLSQFEENKDTQGNQRYFKNGYLQIILSDNSSKNFVQELSLVTTNEFQLPVLLYSTFLSLLVSIENVSENKQKSITTSHWTAHRVATIVCLHQRNKDKSGGGDGDPISEVVDGVKNVGGATRRGDIVFLGPKSMLMPLFDDYSVIKSLKYKSGLLVDTPELLVVTEPMVYTGKMTVSPKVPSSSLGHVSTKRINVQQRHIRVSGSKMPPYCDVRIGKDGQKIFSGSNYAIIKSASIKYNFTFDLEAPPKKSPGTKLKNGTWIGMLADVVADRADITIVNAYNVERYHVIDFTTPFTVTNLVYATSHAQTKVSLAAIVYPYNVHCWMLIIFYFIMVMPIFGLFFWFNPYGFSRDWKDILFKSIFIPIAHGLRQDVHVPHGLNFLSLVWMVFIILIDIGYESNLVSYLSFPEPGVIPTNFEELAARPEYNVHFNIFSNIGRSLFRKGQSDMLKRLNKKYLTEEATVDCVIGAFTSERAACVGWDDILNSGIGKNLTLTFGIEPLFMSQHSLVNNFLAFGLRKDSEYTEAFSYIASSYGDTGLVRKWKEEIMTFYRKIGQGWMSTQVNSSLHEQLTSLALGNSGDPKPFKMDNVLIAFVVFWLGMLFSTVVFGVERLPLLLKLIKAYNSSHNNYAATGWNKLKKLSFPGRKFGQLDPFLTSPELGMSDLYMSSFWYKDRPKTRPSAKGGQML